MSTGSRPLKAVAASLLFFAAACADRNPVAPVAPPTSAPSTVAYVQCRVTVRTGSMECAPYSPPSATGARAAIFGSQDVLVKIASTGTTYDAGTEVLQTQVNIQNLAKQTMGTVDGVKIFFVSGPVVTSGGGSIEVINEDGAESFTSGMQEYFQYEALAPYQISGYRTWQFSASPEITFSFVLAVSADLSEGPQAVVDAVWDGSESTDWGDPDNWSTNAVPDANSVVSIPADSLLASPNMPVLSASTSIAALRVGFASTLTIDAGVVLTSSGNVDAVGTISGGTVQMTGTGQYVGGNISSLLLTGSAQVQRAIHATGALSVQDGALSVKDQTLSISVP